MIDLPAYLKRIDYHGDLTPSRNVLDALCLRHATRIPFENLDILLGRPIQVDLEAIQNKLVLGNRGGYCFEHNLLMAAVLEQLGFAVTKLAARVRLGSDQVRARTHMTLIVDLDNTRFLTDVGFGAQGFLQPLPFEAQRTFQRFLWTYRIMPAGQAWVVQMLEQSDWIDLYAFTLEPQHWVDFKVANYYVSTHPDSQFTGNLIAQRPTPDARYSLHNFDLRIDRGSGSATRTLQDETERLTILAEVFGLRFSSSTTFQM